MKKHSIPAILHIASGDLWAGAEVQMFTLVKHLHTQLGVPVSAVLLNHGTLEKRLREINVQVTVLDETRMNGLHILYALYRIIQKDKPNVIHTHRHKENILGSIAAYLAGSIPSLRTVHGVLEKRPSWLQLHKIIIYTLDRLTGRFLQQIVVSVSGDLADILSRDYPIKRIRVIENGLDLDTIKKQQQTLTSENTRDGTFRIGMVGRLVPVKRVDLFIKAAQLLHTNHDELNCVFLIYGDGPLREEMEQLCLEAGIADIIHFEGHNDEILPKIQSLDLMLVTSDHEGLPMVLLEAMALGTPVIAHAVGGIPKLLDNGSCGVLVTDHSASGYAESIVTHLKSPETFSALTSNARSRVIEHYTAQQNAREYLSLYSELVFINE